MHHVAHEHVPGGELGGMQGLERVGQVQPVERVVCLEKQRGEVGAGCERRESDRAVTGHAHRPHRASR